MGRNYLLFFLLLRFRKLLGRWLGFLLFLSFFLFIIIFLLFKLYLCLLLGFTIYKKSIVN